MPTNPPSRWRRFAAWTAVAVACAAVAMLAWDHVRWESHFDAERALLDQIEQTARDDPQATDQLQELVDRQTDESLVLKRRERTAGIIALVAAGLAVGLLKPPLNKKPALPITLAEKMPQPAVEEPRATEEGDGEAAILATVEEPPLDVTHVSAIVDRIGREKQRVIPLLHAIQQEYRYLPAAALDELCRLTDVSPTQVAGVASFYTRFRTRPRGEHMVEVCRGTACHVAGADRVLEELRRTLDIPAGGDTDAELRATVETVGCIGCCTLAPVVKRDEQIHSHVRVENLPEIIEPCRNGHASQPISSSFFNRIAAFWSNAHEQEIETEIPAAILLNDEPQPHGEEAVAGSTSHAPTRVVTDHWRDGQPISIEAYQRDGGFAALAKCLEQAEPSAILAQMEASGLRGRGGGGFPTYRKWRMVADAAGEKYVVVNGDEGDPGAFMDRSIMETCPGSVLEGLLIAAYAVGASRGYVYVRNEYPVAVQRIETAVTQMRNLGLLGENILGSRFAFDIQVVEGGGAFVCGEETALIESIEGGRGTPRVRPPYPVEEGLWGRPTLVNNVETLASVPWIIRHGAERFAAMGTAASKGAKVFSLAGKVRHGGLVEAPMGMTIRQVVEDFGGGPEQGRTFKAVQIGGPSGGCIPAELADTPIDYEALRELGAIMGSGGLVVLDDTDCMVDVARYFLEFTQQESCGHCTFCRVGTRKLLDILERLCEGKGSKRDLHEIETLSQSITLGSLCGLGKTAPNPVVTTLRYFRDEYQAHLEGRCPAGRCKSLIRYEVTTDCVGCTLCAQHCPVAAIDATPYQQHVIQSDLCTRCDACRTVCPEKAIEVI